jgi:multidrug transporter EmrE-like cation transporter
MLNIMLLSAASLSYTLAGVCMKYSQGLTKGLPSILLFALSVTAATFQTIAMKDSEMAVSYIFVVGLESVLAFLLGVVVFQESASVQRIVAVCLVTAGILLLHR